MGHTAHIEVVELEMAAPKKTKAGGTRRGRGGEVTGGEHSPEAKATVERKVAADLTAALEHPRQAGVLDGNRTEHVSFRAPPALVEAAKCEAGVESTTELGILALAMLAQPDPVATFFKRTDGQLGEDHTLEY
jgi:hypothetical protein